MPSIGLSIDISGYVEEVEQARSRDIPFVTAKALTRVAQDAQTEVRRTIQRDFTLRNDWTQRNIKITPAQKLSWPITAEVYTDTANEKSGAPDYLEAQEDGGDKVPFAGGHYLAIPTKYLRKYAPKVIPDELRPRNLLPPDAQVGKAYKGSLSSAGAKRYQNITKRGLRSLGSKEYVGFLQVDKRGTLCIFIRASGKRDAEPWYVLVPHATIRPVLEMAKTVERIAEERFETHWDDAWAALSD